MKQTKGLPGFLKESLEGGFFGLAVPGFDFSPGEAKVTEGYRQRLLKVDRIVVRHDDLHPVAIGYESFDCAHLIGLIESRDSERIQHSGGLSYGLDNQRFPIVLPHRSA
jgi:hypothetical protein